MYETWKDKGTYYVHASPQRSPEWHEERRKHLTASHFYDASRPETYDEVVSAYNGTKTFSEYSLTLMNHGISNEPQARKNYEEMRGVEVRETGLAVPKWDTRLGGSSDGDVWLDGVRIGVIEIKSPLKLYKNLNPDDPKSSRIYDRHYAQMQGIMAITNSPWCDYVVDTPRETYIETIDYNAAYWEGDLYPKLCAFLELHPNFT